MDLMQRIGGRKFLMALAVLGVGTFLELRGPNGLSETMAAFMGSLVGLFSLANYASTSRYMTAKSSRNETSAPAVSPELEAKVDQISAILSQGVGNPENLNMLLEVLGKMKADIEQVKTTAGQIGMGVVNLSKRG